MMARRKKQSIEDSFVSLSLLVGFVVWGKSGSLALAVVSFVLCVLIICGCLLVYKNHKNKILLQSGIDQVDKMSGEQFELFVLAHFERLGYKGKTTPRTNDYGADLCLEKDGVKTVVQAKRWNDKVGIKAVQEVIGAIRHYNAQKAIVIANNWFTNSAKSLAASNEVELWDRTRLINIMSGSNGDKLANQIMNQGIAEPPKENKRCPRCGNFLVLRKGKKGVFYGCTSFPKCRYTMDHGEAI